MWPSILKNLRWCSLIMGLLNLAILTVGLILIRVVCPSCGHKDILTFVAILLCSFIRIVVMIRTGIAQQATAIMMLNSPAQSALLDAVIRHQRRIRYKRWLWWTRFLMATTVLQFVGTAYLMIIVAKYVLEDGTSSNCVLGHVSNGTRWQQYLLVFFIIMVFFVAILQCFTGTDILRWRSFYATEHNAWKTHYREVFDHGIREAFCCLGRVKYLNALEEDEIYSVAQLLGDLVAYRAAGTGHLELLAGLALLQKHSQSPQLYEVCLETPEERIQEAAAFHPFAEAAYTGLLLDIGRNPVLFPCAWLYRQGVLTPWTRNRLSIHWAACTVTCVVRARVNGIETRPVLQGDNWWRGHAAAFLKYVNLSPEALRQGRVNQARCEAAYFIVVLHHLKSVVIAVRGTETPEDLITDGLCRECILSLEDLDGLINCNHIRSDIRHGVISSMSHYGHSGIVEAARDLFMQIEGNSGEDDVSPESGGLLSSLLGAGCECEGYSIRIVGHSLGGAIASFLGVRLYGRFPNLHVYAYGPLPCMDPIIADACSEFVTSIVYNNEFSSRLSVASMLRLRAAALTALPQDKTDVTITSRLAERFLFVSKYERTRVEEKAQAAYLNSKDTTTEGSRVQQEQEFSLWQDTDTDTESRSNDEINQTDPLDDFTNPFYASPSPVDVNSSVDLVSEFMETIPLSENGQARDLPEMFLAGHVIHIVPQETTNLMPLWKSWRTQGKSQNFKAYIANREAFKDIVVSTSMFFDHLPWRCSYAMKKLLEARSAQSPCDGSQMA